ncbi:DUF2156 domain-containing protein [Acetivibrio cellulolyticus]|uniref:DUF2156 domain-containing protein n=1 Tax=Acetivibrio cellulolyticus TaxID=35830 RepID=UPI0001E2DEB4|nr:phosphatidylglycerol lysyltransferase domain-containing protein [Acetivibrio cellulolyticus]
MLDLMEVTIDNKQLFDQYISKHNPQVSELSFTNIFMWRNSYKFRFGKVGELLCLISVPDDTEPFAFEPIGEYSEEGFKQAIDEIKEYFRAKGWKLIFKRVEEDKLNFFEKYFGDEIDITHDRDNSDYVYLSQDLINLSGKKYHGKKNHINSFKKQYEYEYVRLSEDLIGECVRINEEWCARRSCDLHKGLYCEKMANNEVLSNFKGLGFEGALIKVNGRYEAYTVGEILNQNTAVIHIEKANDDIRGLYTFINQQFCENCWKDVEYVNREQDLGVEGLRKAKLSYNPVRFVKKYVIAYKYV